MATERRRIEPHAHPLGSRAQRLAGAYKQLEIVLEDVDLAREPTLGEAVTDAVAAADRAYHAETGQDARLKDAVDEHE